MPTKTIDEGAETADATMASLRELSRVVGKKGLPLTSRQIDDMIRATRTLLDTLEFKKRLSAANKQ